MDKPQQPPVVSPAVPEKSAIPPSPGEVIASLATGNTYTMGGEIGEGNFSVVYSCTDVWGNDLAAKVLKPIATYEAVRASATDEFAKLMTFRNPYITFVYDAFEFRNTFYIITERCLYTVKSLFSLPGLIGQVWLIPIARCLLQAIHYLHINNYVHQDIHCGNVFAALIKDDMVPSNKDAIKFKLGDLGIAKLIGDLKVENTRAQWMLPPEVLSPKDFGTVDHRIDIYHVGLLLLELAYSKELRFTSDEIINGKPREMALALPSPYKVALEKALRRHVQFRTADAMELWRDLHTPQQPMNQMPQQS
jgi:eukaryotic-like serine/threonine-protein kinase